MTNLIASLILAGLGLILFAYVYFADLRRIIKEGRFFGSPLAKATLILILIIPGSLLLVNMFLSVGILPSGSFVSPIAIMLAGLTSLLWAKYIRAIDIYEPERKRYLLLTFIAACITVFFVFPISRMINYSGFVLNGEGLNDFLYCVISIGSVEEFVKIIPLVLLLLFTSQINEPLDFIVYGSISALGFAFIENILYLTDTGLSSLSGRLLYSSVAHMFFTSIISYAMALSKLKFDKIKMEYVFIGFILASLAHGFYDFWLINEKFYFPLITTFFFLASLHLWVTMKNNLINMSNFFDKSIRLNKEKLQYGLITMLVLVIYLGYIFSGALFGSAEANKVLMNSFIYYLFTVVYITVTFSQFQIIRGYKAPIRLTKRFFKPVVKSFPNYVGAKIYLEAPMTSKRVAMPVYGELTERKVVGEDYNWYAFKNRDETYSFFILKPLDNLDGFTRTKPIKVKLCQLDSYMDLKDPVIDPKSIVSCTMYNAFRR